MPKEDMLKLVEALASIGSRVMSFNWKIREEPPFGWEIDLKILKTTSVEKKD